ncbi:MAG: metallophosphoesterase [Bryobacteraceae bacterium]
MATFGIGDIHGNIRALDDLLARITPKIGDRDTVVFLGDYIDRGPDSKACIERILDFRQTAKAMVVALLGNHEQWLLKTHRDHTRHSWILGMQGFSTIQSYSSEAAVRLDEEFRSPGPRIVLEHVSVPYQIFFDVVPAEHLEFFSSLSTFHRTPDAVCVHGGLDPAGGRAEEQADANLIWGAVGFPTGYQGSDPIIYGHAHDPVIDRAGWPHPRVVGHTYGLDTIGEDVLTALRLPDGAVFQSRRFQPNRIRSSTSD